MAIFNGKYVINKLKDHNKRVLLIKASEQCYVHATGHPLGLLYIASYLRQNGFNNIPLIDLRLIPPKKQFKILHDKLISEPPFVIGISAMSYEAHQVSKMVQFIRTIIPPETTVIIGGPFASSSPEDALAICGIDFAVIGEGEVTMLELTKALAGGKPTHSISGIAYRNESGHVVITDHRELIRNIDSIPHPAWDLLDIEAYNNTERFNRWYKEKRYMTLLTSRGCNYTCSFCHNIFGKTFRGRSPENVVGEMKIAVKKYGVREFVIVDDSFNLDTERAKEICDRIIYDGLDVHLTFPNGLRADRIDRELLDKMKKAGTYRVAYAVESKSACNNGTVGKHLQIDKTLSVIQMTDEMDIITHGFFIIGLPGETIEDIEQTIFFAASSKLHTANFFFLDAYPGTKLWKEVQKRYSGVTTFDIPYSYYKNISLVSDLHSTILGKLGRKAHRRFFLRFWRIYRLFQLIPLKYFIEGIGVFILRGFFLWRQSINISKTVLNKSISKKTLTDKKILKWIDSAPLSSPSKSALSNKIHRRSLNG